MNFISHAFLFIVLYFFLNAPGVPVYGDDSATNAGPAATSPTAPTPGPEMDLDLGNNVTLKMAYIPAGKFIMGSPASEPHRFPNEGPQHEVTISHPFYFSACTITQQQYKALMGAIPVNPDPKGPKPVEGDNLPVHPMSYDDITNFCQKLSEKTGKKVRPNTEAEWEYACRAGTTTTWYFGDDPKDASQYGWFWQPDRSKEHPNPVGQKKPNAWGMYDMYGNVGQVCSDWGGHYPKATEADYTKDPVTDPTGPATPTEQHVIRGNAAWVGNSRSAGFRGAFAHPEWIGDHMFGFRVVVEIPH
jgi:formylglycine-generating enzyme required for sulfatase activity